ncbi:MAG: ABC transporter permease [Candidatus Omnitrophica bacterium]|nr:ABC transporter permease [Candidatus Omnitrophota bacterium]
MLRKSVAFLKKDFLLESSYRISFLFNMFGVLMSVLGYFFIDKLFGQRIVGHLQEFGVSYFSYVLLGMAFFNYIGVGLGSFSARIRAEQYMGTLEAILMTPTSGSVVLFSMALWNLFMATMDMVVYIILGASLFKIDFSHINIFSTVVTSILTLVCFSSLGIISASFIMVFKQGNPVGWVINQMEGLLGGVYFPITVLPSWLQIVAKFFPITYSIRAIQLAVYRGYSVIQLIKEIIFLSCFCILLLPLSLIFFRYALKKVKKQGSLAQY